MYPTRMHPSARASSSVIRPTSAPPPPWTPEQRNRGQTEEDTDSMCDDAYSNDCFEISLRTEWLCQLKKQVMGKLYTPALTSRASLQPRDKKRRHDDDLDKTFFNALHSLQVAYYSLLDAQFTDNCSHETATTVDQLEDQLKKKLPYTEGTQLLEQLLEQCRQEFQWTKIAEVLEAAKVYAHAKAQKESEDSENTHQQLLQHVGPREALRNPQVARLALEKSQIARCHHSDSEER